MLENTIAISLLTVSMFYCGDISFQEKGERALSESQLAKADQRLPADPKPNEPKTQRPRLIPTNVSDVHQRWETILAQRTPKEFGSVKDPTQLLGVLRNLGLPVILTDSAKEDLLTMDEQFDIEVMNIPIIGTLENLLRRYNAGIALSDHCIKIISLEDELDPEYFYIVLYDVSYLCRDSSETRAVCETIQSTIAPDSWETGRGCGVMIAHELKGRQLLSVRQNYGGQKKIQNYLEDLATISTAGDE